MAVEYELLDALDLYADIMNEILSEMGVDGKNYTRDELKSFAKAGFAEFDNIWQDFLLWVLYGDDKRAKTMAIVRAGRRRNRPYRL